MTQKKISEEIQRMIWTMNLNDSQNITKEVLKLVYEYAEHQFQDHKGYISLSVLKQICEQ